MKNKKVIIGVIIALIVIIAVVICIAVGNSNKDNSSTETNPSATVAADNNSAEEEKQMTEKPVFMYFVSASDDKHDETMQILSQLQTEFADKVTFNIVDIDTTPDAVEQYSLAAFATSGSPTPTLFMLDTTGNFSAIKNGFADKDELTDTINSTLK